MPTENNQFRLARIINEQHIQTIQSPMQDQLVWGVTLRYEDNGEQEQTEFTFFPTLGSQTREVQQHLKVPNSDTLLRIQRLCSLEITKKHNTPTIYKILALTIETFPWFVDVDHKASGAPVFKRPGAESMFKALVKQYSDEAAPT